MRPYSQAKIPLPHGEFEIYVFHDDNGKEHVALKKNKLETNPLVRIHSECFTGDILHSLKCDCGSQLADALDQISKAGSGLIVYLRQEGRGIGLGEKIKAYQLQEQGRDTVDANLDLGFKADERDYSVVKGIFDFFNIKTLKLITNNPDKIKSLETLGYTVTDRVTSHGKVNDINKSYLETKKRRMNHQLDDL